MSTFMDPDPEKTVSTYQHRCEIRLTNAGIILDAPLRSVRTLLLALEEFQGHG